MNFLKRLWSYRFVRFLVWSFGSLLTLYVLFFAWVNYYGAKKWAAAQSMLQREGETMDFRALVAAPVPEDKNFCAIPVLKDLALVVDNDSDKGEPGAKRKRLESAGLPSGDAKSKQLPPRPKPGFGATLGMGADLKAWADWLRREGSLQVPDSGNPARDVLAGLSKHGALMTELAAGLDRPDAHWTPEWKVRDLPEMLFLLPLPQYRAAQAMVTMLCLRATAAARAGDARTAHQSLLIALRLARASLNDPFLIGELVAVTQAMQISNAVWEVCDAHAGTSEDFRRLQEELARLDFEKALLQAYREELAGGVNAIMWIKGRADAEALNMITGQNSWDPKQSPGLLGRMLFRLIPGGLFHLNAAAMAELEFNLLIKPLRDGGTVAAEADEEALQRKIKAIPQYRIDKIFARVAIPAFSKITVRAIYARCVNAQAIIACALERSYAEHQTYPDSLASLGQSLPGDPLSGKPLGYRKTPAGKYVLWCVGLDKKDGGGKRVLDAHNPGAGKFSDPKYKGDWVWSFEPGE